MKTRIIGALIFVLTASYVCQAQQVRIKLENCTLDKATLAQIQNSLNYQLRFYSKIFNQPADTSFRARVFGTEKEFVKYSKSKANFNPLQNHSIAFYSHSLNEMICHLEVKDFAKVFSHEVSHAILRYYCKNPATWLNEGLAQFLEDIVANDSAYYIASTQAPKITAVKKLFIEGRSIEAAINSNDFYDISQMHRNYALSYAVVLYLWQARREILSNIVRSDCNDAYYGFRNHYPEGLDLLQADVKSWFLNYDPTIN